MNYLNSISAGASKAKRTLAGSDVSLQPGRIVVGLLVLLCEIPLCQRLRVNGQHDFMPVYLGAKLASSGDELPTVLVALVYMATLVRTEAPENEPTFHTLPANRWNP